MGDYPVPWRVAWQDALYGERGFYRRAEGPAGHFATSAHGPVGTVLAEALVARARADGLRGVVDVGCGRGELLAAVHTAAPDLDLVGVDVVERPPELPATVRWLGSPGGPRLPDELAGLDGWLVVANEWLDVVPCTVAEADAHGILREALVDTGGREAAGEVLSDEDLAWVRRWWPSGVEAPAPGDRVEVGRSRDDAWADLLSRLTSGTALAIDYGHTREARPRHGTLAAYRSGGLVPPVPDGSCDLTAHVAVDSLAHDELTTQREALSSLRAPADQGLARTDPGAYLAALSRASHVAELRHPAGLGAFHWVVRHLPAERTAYSTS